MARNKKDGQRFFASDNREVIIPDLEAGPSAPIWRKWSDNEVAAVNKYYPQYAASGQTREFVDAFNKHFGEPHRTYDSIIIKARRIGKQGIHERAAE